MRVAVEDIGRHLQNGQLPATILLNGNEPLLIEEALDVIRQQFKSAGITERIRFTSETGFDWSQLNDAGQSMSLFAEKRCIELRLPTGKPGDKGSKAIVEYCQRAEQEDVLVVISSYLDKRQRQSKWVKALDDKGWVVDCYEIDAARFPGWLKQRLQSRALRVENGVVDLLVHYLEGNLLAAAQEVDKLQVLAKDGAVTLELVKSMLADQAKFNVYMLVDSCLAGDINKSLRMLHSLKNEDVEPVIVVWALAREVRTMASVSSALQRGENKAQLFRNNRIWSKRESCVNAALQRNTSTSWYAMLQDVAKLDQMVKGQRYSQRGGIWHEIESLCLAICSAEPVKMNKELVMA